MRSTEKMILRALVVSLLVHCLVFGTWKWGQTQGWWTALGAPRWLQMLTKVVAPMSPNMEKKIAQLPQAAPLLFVNVDPALPVEEPKKPEYFGAHSTVAANPEITRPSTVPDIRGQQEKVLRTTTSTKTAQPRPAPTPPAQPQEARQASPGLPKKTYAPGDLATLEPSSKAQEKEGTVDNGSDQPPAEAVHQRPRTLAEAMSRNGITGQKMKQDGGVNHIAADSALNVKGTISGAYFEHFVDTVDTEWQQLLRQAPVNANGTVVLHFLLNYKGQVSNLKLVSSNVNDLLENHCEYAIRTPQFDPWPREMRLENGDSIELTFTFYYETY